MSALPTAAHIQAAVSAANSPTASAERTSALALLDQVKVARVACLPACATLFFDRQSHDAASRSFALSVIDEAIMFEPQLTPHSLVKIDAQLIAGLQQQFVSYISQTYVSGDAEGSNVFLRNKAVHTMFVLFLHTYEASWQGFLAGLFPLLHSSAGSSTGSTFNLRMLDFYLRLLHEIGSEVSDIQLRLNKSAYRLSKDATLRDLIRARDQQPLAASIFEALTEMLATLDTAQPRPDLVDMAVRTVVDYVGWLDINLMVTPATVNLIFRCMQLPATSPAFARIRVTATEALVETVSRGMPAADKLELVRALDLRTILETLQTATAAMDLTDEGNVAFRTQVARLLNATGVELAKLCEDTTATDETKAAALAYADELLPLTLKFLDDASSVTVAATAPFPTAIMSLYKKDKKAANLSQSTTSEGFLAAEKRAYLSELLQLVVRKMEWPADADWALASTEDEGSEDENTLFYEMRRGLKILLDAIAYVDEDMFAALAKSVILSVLDTVDAGGAAAQALAWQRVELALHILYLFGEAAKSRGTAQGSFVIVPQAEFTRAKQSAEFRIDYSQYPLSTLGECVLRLTRSPVSSWPHPSAPLQFFECVVRYHDFFALVPESIPNVLSAFLDERGLHQPMETARSRCFYLFHRFIAYAKMRIQQYASGELIAGILTAMQDLLVVEAELLPTDSPEEDPLARAAHTPSKFDSQLYLFEAVGTLVHILNQIPDEQVRLLKAIIDPLVEQIRASVRTSMASVEDVVAILRLHHLILAIAGVCKGFPMLSSRATVATGIWVEPLVSAMQTIAEVVKVMSGFSIVREAALAAFKVVVAVTGTAILPLVPTLFDCVLNQLKPRELVDFLPFTSLLLHKYKAEFTPLLDVVLQPILARIHFYLAQPINGTDDVLQHSELRRGYFALLQAILAINQQNVFLSERNRPQLDQMLASIVHYITADEPLLPDIRQGVAVINKLVGLWVPGGAVKLKVTANGAAATGVAATSDSPVPEFGQFVYGQVVPLAFTTPMLKRFDYADAQAYQVIGEFCVLLKSLQAKRGNEFIQHLTSTVLPAAGCPEAAAQPMLKALTEAPDPPTFKKFLAVRLQLVKTNADPSAQPWLQQARQRGTYALS